MKTPMERLLARMPQIAAELAALLQQHGPMAIEANARSTGTALCYAFPDGPPLRVSLTIEPDPQEPAGDETAAGAMPSAAKH